MEGIPGDLIFNIGDFSDSVEELSGNSGCTMLIFVPKNSYTPDQKGQLSAICKAINIDLSLDVHLLALHNNSIVRIKEWNNSAKHLLLFGIPATSIGQLPPHPPYQWIRLEDMLVLQCEDLTTLQINMEAKKRLWSCLKAHFIDKTL